MKYDTIVIGMGISGISAAIYLKNSGLNVLMLEKDIPGGLLNKISKINNYPGYSETTGADLSLELFLSIQKLNIPFKIAEVTNISIQNKTKIVDTNLGTFETSSIIIATGRKSRKLGLLNEKKLLGKGISTCALCDGFLYKGKDIAVVGGGNSALEEAIYLSDIVNKIFLIHRRDTFRAETSLVEKLKEKTNIEILYNSEITSILEEKNQIKEIVINHKKHISVVALFTYIGFEPNQEFLESLDIHHDSGYIIVNEKYQTNINDIYAVGDCIKKDIYQLITAANDGVVAALDIIKTKKNLN